MRTEDSIPYTRRVLHILAGLLKRAWEHYGESITLIFLLIPIYPKSCQIRRCTVCNHVEHRALTVLVFRNNAAF